MNCLLSILTIYYSGNVSDHALSLKCCVCGALSHLSQPEFLYFFAADTDFFLRVVCALIVNDITEPMLLLESIRHNYCTVL